MIHTHHVFSSHSILLVLSRDLNMYPIKMMYVLTVVAVIVVNDGGANRDGSEKGPDPEQKPFFLI